jgi:hypothetical protein
MAGVDEADRIDDWLYLPEILYAFMLIIVVSAGAGPYSLDAVILGLINKHDGDAAPSADDVTSRATAGRPTQSSDRPPRSPKIPPP